MRECQRNNLISKVCIRPSRASVKLKDSNSQVFWLPGEGGGALDIKYSKTQPQPGVDHK